MARTKDGWVKMYANLILRDLDLGEIAYYTTAYLLANPKDSENPGRFDIKDYPMSLLLNCNNKHVTKIKQRLLSKGLLLDNGDGTYTVNGYQEAQTVDFLPSDALLQNRLPLEDLLRYKANLRQFKRGTKPQRSRRKLDTVLNHAIGTVSQSKVGWHSIPTIGTVSQNGGASWHSIPKSASYKEV